VHDLLVPDNGFAEVILAGLKSKPKAIAPKFFYDRRGSALFNAITRQPEYYLTRVDTEIIAARAAAIAKYVGSGVQLVEFGSGSSIKISHLLDAIRPSTYMPMDISREHLIESSIRLQQEFPWLDIHAVCIDYAIDLILPFREEHTNLVAFFPGSSIGNFEPAAAARFLQNSATLLGKGGHLIVSVDLKKDVSHLNAAYNDRAGITAEFNLNLLQRINRELGANFDIDQFRHRAWYNATAGRIEMHLESLVDHDVTIGKDNITFTAGETLHTENSYKYTVAEFRHLARLSGYCPLISWVDQEELFSVHVLQSLGISSV
jgi:dimethylhistidine N-methyltransferase